LAGDFATLAGDFGRRLRLATSASDFGIYAIMKYGLQF